MSRRSHVVRTEDGAATANPRSLAGGAIFCATEPAGTFDAGGPLETCAIAVDSDAAYRRVYVAATIEDVTVVVPDPPPPPGPGDWVVRFEVSSAIERDSGRWATGYYTPPAGTTGISISWGGLPDEINLETEFAGMAFYTSFGGFEDHWKLYQTTGHELIEPDEDVDRPMRFELTWSEAPVWCEMHLSSPYGEHEPYTVIWDGYYVG